MSTWRDRARPIIARVLKENAGKSESEIKQALRDAFPWGSRELHPYKIWLSEIRYQRGLAQDKRKKKGERLTLPECDGQGGLFE